MSTGQKHLLTCRCILQQYKSLKHPPFHKFVVFSVLDDADVVQKKFVQCNNCGIIHKITDLCKSTIIQSKENMNSLITIDDIKPSISSQLTKILEISQADLPTFEAAQYVVENKQWGDIVILTSETSDDSKNIKYIRILGENLFKVETHIKDNQQ